MKKLFLTILFLFIGTISYGQTIFTQTFVDRCTGDVKVVTANFVNGSATVSFYDKVKTFTYQEFVSGELQKWLNETYSWWQSLSPCSNTTQQTQQAQQTAQNAAQAAQNAATNTTTPPTTNTTGGTNGQTQGQSNSSGNESGNQGSSQESTSENTSEGSGETTSEESGESNGESNEENSESEEVEESSEEESSEESEEESSEEESEEESEESEEESEDEDDKKEKKMMPIQLRADMMANQALLGNYDIVTSIGATQSSIYGDVTYGATAMIWSNLRQFAINTSYSKVHMEKFDLTTISHDGHTHYSKSKEVTVDDPITPPTPKLLHITSASVGYMNNFGNGAIVGNYMKIKPTKYGTLGAGINMANMFGEGRYQISMIGYNILYTNQIMLTNRINYTPAFIWNHTPYMGRLGLKNDLSGQRAYGMMILANSFTVQLTRRFSFNVGATFIKSMDPNIPLIKSFMIGAKLPF